MTRVRTRFSTIEAIEQEVFAADVVIGAVLVPGASAPKLISREMLQSMQRGSVLVDVAIDQGGSFETSQATTTPPTKSMESSIIVLQTCRVPFPSHENAATKSQRIGCCLRDAGDCPLQMATIRECRYRWLRGRDFNLLRFFGPCDRKSRRAQLSVRHGDRNYDRGIAGLGTGRLAYLMNDGPTLRDRQLRSVTTARIDRRVIDSADPVILVRQ